MHWSDINFILPVTIASVTPSSIKRHSEIHRTPSNVLYTISPAVYRCIYILYHHDYIECKKEPLQVIYLYKLVYMEKYWYYKQYNHKKKKNE
jgi:hypothetical protein